MPLVALAAHAERINRERLAFHTCSAASVLDAFAARFATAEAGHAGPTDALTAQALVFGRCASGALVDAVGHD